MTGRLALLAALAALAASAAIPLAASGATRAPIDAQVGPKAHPVASGNALWICSARLSLVVTRSEGGLPSEKSSAFATSTSTLPERFSAPAARSASSAAPPDVQLKASSPKAAASANVP